MTFVVLSIKLQVSPNVAVNLLCDRQEHLWINNNTTLFSCATICRLHKEQRRQYPISPQREVFYLCILLSASEMSHTTQTGTVISNLSGRLADSVSHRDMMFPTLIHKK